MERTRRERRSANARPLESAARIAQNFISIATTRLDGVLLDRDAVTTVSFGPFLSRPLRILQSIARDLWTGKPSLVIRSRCLRNWLRFKMYLIFPQSNTIVAVRFGHPVCTVHTASAPSAAGLPAQLKIYAGPRGLIAIVVRMVCRSLRTGWARKGHARVAQGRAIFPNEHREHVLLASCLFLETGYTV